MHCVVRARRKQRKRNYVHSCQSSSAICPHPHRPYTVVLHSLQLPQWHCCPSVMFQCLSPSKWPSLCQNTLYALLNRSLCFVVFWWARSVVRRHLCRSVIVSAVDVGTWINTDYVVALPVEWLLREWHGPICENHNLWPAGNQENTKTI